MICTAFRRRLALLSCSIAAALASAPAVADVTGEGDVSPFILISVNGGPLTPFPSLPIDGGTLSADLIVGGTDIPEAYTSVGIVTIDVPAFTDPLIAPNVFIGDNANGLGQVAISGLFSELRSDNLIVVGVEGQGYLDITSGALVTSNVLAAATDPDAVVGQFDTSQGYVTISGFGSNWRHTALVVGDLGYGELRVANRGRLETLTEAIIGNDVDLSGTDDEGLGTGYVELTGQGTRWDVAETLTVGLEGRGELQVRSGALARVAEEIFVSDEVANDGVNSRGIVVVSDQNTELWTLDTLAIGSPLNANAQGELYVRDGGRVRADGGMTVGVDDLVEMSGAVNRPTILSPTLDNNGIIRGAGRLEVAAITNDGYIRNSGNGLDVREKLWVTGTVQNNDNIESIGGEMEFLGEVVNDAADGDILGIDALFRFSGGLVNNGRLILDNSVIWQPSTQALVNNGVLSLWGSNTSTIMGDVTLGGGSIIEMDIGNDFSQLVIGGDATLGGFINFTLSGGYTPQMGDSFEIIRAESLSGTFANANITPAPGLSFSINYVGDSVFLEFGAALPPVTADFNGDGVVDGADLAVWEMNFGLMPATMAQGDANGDGVVDGADFNIWQQQLGPVIASTAATPAVTPATGAVPEPNGLAMAALALLGLSRFRKRAG